MWHPSGIAADSGIAQLSRSWIHHAGSWRQWRTASGTVNLVVHLRKSNSYLSPNVGTLSLEGWALISTMIGAAIGG